MKMRKILASAILAEAVCSAQAHMFWVDGQTTKRRVNSLQKWVIATIFQTTSL